MIGEMRSRAGGVTFGGPVSYFQQHPWIQSCSVRANILFGKGGDPALLAQTVRVCALERDLEALEDGLDAEVGERGVTLSGGQQARLQLGQ